MRIIAGSLGSRRLVTPAGQRTRPTSDRLRETLMNVLAPRLEGCRFADLYAGSGAVGLEALSRGAASCSFVERSPQALLALRSNLRQLGVQERAVVDTRPVLKVLTAAQGQHVPFDLVFLDPPYDADEEYQSSLGALGRKNPSLLAPKGIVVAEHARRTGLQANYGSLQRFRVLEQGDSALSFFAAAVQAAG